MIAFAPLAPLSQRTAAHYFRPQGMSGDPGPSNAPPPGLEMEDDEEDNLDETAALQIESDLANPANKGRGGLLGRLVRPGSPKRYGKARGRGPRGGVVGRAKELITGCAGRFTNVISGGALGGAETEEEPLLFALTWAQPQRYGIPPSPRNGHTMVLVGMQLYVFGGGDETVSYNDVHTLHVGTMTWEKPVVHGTLPSPRSRHSATAVGNNMVVFGGVGGGNDLHILETDTLTWYVPKAGGEPPLPRFGHSSTLVESAADQSRKIYIFGGHDGRRSLSDLHLFDTESMAWTKAVVSGRAPLAGSRPPPPSSVIGSTFLAPPTAARSATCTCWTSTRSLGCRSPRTARRRSHARATRPHSSGATCSSLAASAAAARSTTCSCYIRRPAARQGSSGRSHPPTACRPRRGWATPRRWSTRRSSSSAATTASSASTTSTSSSR